MNTVIVPLAPQVEHRVNGRHRADHPAVTSARWPGLVDEDTYKPRHRLAAFIVEWTTGRGKPQRVLVGSEAGAATLAARILHGGGADVAYFEAPEPRP